MTREREEAMRIPQWLGVSFGISMFIGASYAIIVYGGRFLEWSGLGDALFTIFAIGQLGGLAVLAIVIIIGVGYFIYDRLRR